MVDRSYSIAVVPESVAVLEAVGRRFDLDYTFDNFDRSCERYHEPGFMMPDDGLDQIRNHDAILWIAD